MFMSKNVTASQQNGITFLNLHLNLFIFLKICFKWVLDDGKSNLNVKLEEITILI